MIVYVHPRNIEWQAVNRGLKGQRALLLAIIAQAYYDLSQGDEDAASYFAGPTYRHHLELLELPPNWLPDGVTIKREGPGLRVVAVEEHIYELSAN